MTIYDRIRTRREELGMSQQELANKLGYKSRSAINKIESGLRDINQSKICEFAAALDTTPSYLMGLEENEKKDEGRANMEDKELLQAIGKMLEPLYKDMGELKDDVQSLKADNAKLVEMEKSLRLLVEGQQGMNEKFKQLDKLTADVEDIKLCDLTA